MANESILLVVDPPPLRAQLETQLSKAGYQVLSATDWREGEKLLSMQPVDVILLDAHLPGLQSWDALAELCQKAPDRPVVIVGKAEPELVRKAWLSGVTDILNSELNAVEIVQRALARREQLRSWQWRAVQRATQPLKRRLAELETLSRIGKAIITHLDLDAVLQQVVSAAVSLTSAEEGSLLLLDEQSGELYMRAAQNFNEDFVRTFRLPAEDSLAGQVVQSGEPLLFSHASPTRIKTAYLIRDLAYVPLKSAQGVIGVLGVDNRSRSNPFNQNHVALLSALADYAVIAIENARLYHQSEMERLKLSSVLKHIGEGVLVIDQVGRILLINQLAAAALNLDAQQVIGQHSAEVIAFEEIQMMLLAAIQQPRRLECTLAGDHVFNVYVAPIPGVGQVVTLQDVTYLKQIDRIKSDFVNTVSHDLRSPLTAILGYVELVERIGNLSDQQKAYLERVRVSVSNITQLINTLLELGRIETGVDFDFEPVPLAAIVGYAIDGLRHETERRDHEVIVRIPANLPPVLGNPLRLRQMLDNLLSNALRYTPRGGKITIAAQRQGDQIILQVKDNGIGIPHVDQPFIFDKFYRGSNVPPEETGTGLGLAIVKSIVEQHQGRIWVESQPGRGTAFFVVLPLAES